VSKSVIAGHFDRGPQPFPARSLRGSPDGTGAPGHSGRRFPSLARRAGVKCGHPTRVGGAKILVVSRGILSKKHVECTKRRPFSAERRAVFPVFIIWKYSLKLGLSNWPFACLIVVGIGTTKRTKSTKKGFQSGKRTTDDADGTDKEGLTGKLETGTLHRKNQSSRNNCAIFLSEIFLSEFACVPSAFLILP
jgi:hypothetical protein